MATKVLRDNIADINEEPRQKLSTWALALQEAVNIGVRKGRLPYDCGEMLKGIIYRSKRRAIFSHTTKDLLEASKLIAFDLLGNVPEIHATDYNWKQRLDWLINHLPQLWQEIKPLMVQYPIPL